MNWKLLNEQFLTTLILWLTQPQHILTERNVSKLKNLSRKEVMFPKKVILFSSPVRQVLAFILDTVTRSDSRLLEYKNLAKIFSSIDVTWHLPVKAWFRKFKVQILSMKMFAGASAVFYCCTSPASQLLTRRLR